MASRLFLADDVFFCATQGYGVFLNLKQDEYAAVRLHGREGDAASTDEETLSLLLAPHERDLFASGLLTHKARSTSLSAWSSIHRPDRHIFPRDDCRAFGGESNDCNRLRHSVVDKFRFVQSCRWASHELQARRIWMTIADLKASVRGIAGGSDILAVHDAVAAFRKWRPWYARRYLCLFDSLALMQFLGRKNLRAELVFGVQAEPFVAHCWVQRGTILLNESLEHASQFTPIMVAGI